MKGNQLGGKCADAARLRKPAIDPKHARENTTFGLGTHAGLRVIFKPRQGRWIRGSDSKTSPSIPGFEPGTLEEAMREDSACHLGLSPAWWLRYYRSRSVSA